MFIRCVCFLQYLFLLLTYWTFEIEHCWNANWLLLVLLFFRVSTCMSYWDQILSSCSYSLSFGLALAICRICFTVFLDLHYLVLIFFLDESTLHAYSVVGHHLPAVIGDLLVPLATISSLPIVLDLFKPLLQAQLANLLQRPLDIDKVLFDVLAPHVLVLLLLLSGAVILLILQATFLLVLLVWTTILIQLILFMTMTML